jgi:hypothetical protein
MVPSSLVTVIRHASLFPTMPWAAAAAFGLSIALTATGAFAQERPYFVTYDDQLAKRREVEVSALTSMGKIKDDGTRYVAPWLEIGYGTTSWWTTELYLEGATYRGDGSAFTGWRLENRFRPLKSDRAVNPILYVEYENISEASRIQKEIVGRGALPRGPIDLLSQERAHELEGRFILSSWPGRWNVSENLIVEKNLSEDEGFEFGYAVGVSRPLGGSSNEACRFCRGALTLGVEAYGGLGSTSNEAQGATRQFIAPIVAWQVARGGLLRASVGFGLTTASDRAVVRFGYTFDLW